MDEFEFPGFEQYIATPKKTAEKQDMMEAIVAALRGQQAPEQGAIGASIANMPQQQSGGVVSATPNGAGYASGAALGQKIGAPIADYLNPQNTATALRYGTTPGSQQTSMLAAQDAGMF